MAPVGEFKTCKQARQQQQRQQQRVSVCGTLVCLCVCVSCGMWHVLYTLRTAAATAARVEHRQRVVWSTRDPKRLSRSATSTHTQIHRHRKKHMHTYTYTHTYTHTLLDSHMHMLAGIVPVAESSVRGLLLPQLSTVYARQKFGNSCVVNGVTC